MAQPLSEHEKIIERAMDALDDLSVWEQDFIVGLSRRPFGYRLSVKQKEVLDRIADKL